MKNRGVAILLAFFLGTFGVHKFYLNNPGAGIFYIMLLMFTRGLFGFGITTLLGFFDGIRLLMMSQREFDRAYNWRHMKKEYRDPRKRPTVTRRRRQRPSTPTTTRRSRRTSSPTSRRRPTPRIRENKFKKSGIKKFREYNIEESLEDFKKAVEISPKDPDIYFNMACAYSLLEKTDKSLEHLGAAVELGMKDKELIHGHDALAYVRIQPEFEDFVENNYQYKKGESTRPRPEDVLEQLNRLKRLKDQGLITEKEYVEEVRRLNR